MQAGRRTLFRPLNLVDTFNPGGTKRKARPSTRTTTLTPDDTSDASNEPETVPPRRQRIHSAAAGPSSSNGNRSCPSEFSTVFPLPAQSPPHGTRRSAPTPRPGPPARRRRTLSPHRPPQTSLQPSSRARIISPTPSAGPPAVADPVAPPTSPPIGQAFPSLSSGGASAPLGLPSHPPPSFPDVSLSPSLPPPDEPG